MSEDMKKMLPTRLLWVDLEMTGLRPEVDVIQEIAAVITDFEFTEIARYNAVIRQPRELVERLMLENPWFLERETNRQQFLEAAEMGQQGYVVEGELIDMIGMYFGEEPVILAGNSIHNDRKFIARYWPELESKLHYRMLDVSAWKVWMQGAYGVEYAKKETHRATDDIEESIAELKYYLGWLHSHGSQDR